MSFIPVSSASAPVPLDRFGPFGGVSTALALVAIVAAIDSVTGYDLRFSEFYLLPIALAAWSAGSAAGIAVALLSSLLWLLSLGTGRFDLHPVYYLWEATAMFAGFLAFAWLIARLRDALGQADARFFGLMEQLPGAVYLADDEHGTVLYANGRLRALCPDTAPSPRALDAAFAVDSELPEAAIGTGFRSATLRHLASGGWYLMQEGPIPWGPRRQARLRLLTDIGAQRHAERLRDKNRELAHRAAKLATLAEIGSTLAHEINQPLMIIATYVDACQRLLERPEIDRGEIGRALGKCHEQAARAASIIERLREFIRQRQHAGHGCEVGAAVGEVIALMRPLADDASVRLEVVVPGDKMSVDTDRLLVGQVLLNLVRNGIEAVAAVEPARRQVRVDVARAAGKVSIVVSDHGPGIDAAMRERLFTPFFTTKPEGLGLGLAISRSIVEAQGGRLWAEDNDGGGCRFCLSLPLAGEEQ